MPLSLSRSPSRALSDNNGAQFGRSPGVGFGLGVAVVSDSTKCRGIRSNGEFYWVGAASTTFFVDPQEGIVAIFLSQLRPWTQYNYMRELRVAVNQVRADEPDARWSLIAEPLGVGFLRQAVCDKPWAKL